MNTRALKHFLALADTLHYGRASTECNISISALSRNIRQLEEEVGVSLFNRDNRTVALTPEGQRFLTYARETRRQWQSIKQSLAGDDQTLRGEVSIYCSVTASYSFLYDLLSRLRATHPGIEIKLHTGDAEHAIGRILSGDEEITIAARPKTLPRGLAFKPITRSPLVFIAPLKQPHGNIFKVPNSREEWQQTPMILSESGVSRNQLDQWFEEAGIIPNIYAQVAGNEAIVSMVSLGFGVGVVPKIVLDNSPLAVKVRVLKVEPALAPYDIGLFTLQKSLKNPVVEAFWNLISADAVDQ
ncbi:MAG: HTH-type transcriptional activator IlvY [Pontibacterium sp.]